MGESKWGEEREKREERGERREERGEKSKGGWEKRERREERRVTDRGQSLQISRNGSVVVCDCDVQVKDWEQGEPIEGRGERGERGKR